ncbi:MAG: carbon storage regulator, partial [Planctomycetales bacterium]|nr:carbon storage regulator [Planctomycetales bacterium]
MLVLSRKNGEQIQIGQDIVIRVCRVQGGRVQ